jgi:hypothetical protein
VIISDNGRLHNPLLLPAKRFVPETARVKMEVSGKPELTAVQLVPLLVERKTPPRVPAKRFAPETARDQR